MSTLPTVNYDPTKTVVPRKTFVKLTPIVNGTPGTAVELIGKVANYGQSIEVVKREVPDSKGFNRPDRIVGKSRSQTIDFELEDVKSIGGAFGTTTIEGQLQKGTCELFVVDPDDATGKCAVKSNVFNAVWWLDGGMNFTVAEFAKAKLKIEATAEVILTPDATVT